MARIKTQKFEALGIEIPIKSDVSFHDDGYQDRLVDWAYEMHSRRPSSPMMKGYLLGQINRGEEREVGFHVPVEIYSGETLLRVEHHIGYKLFKEDWRNVCVRAHEESHAASQMIERKYSSSLPHFLNSPSFRVSEKFLQIAPFLRGNEEEQIAHLGAIFGLTKRSFSMKEAIELYSSFFSSDGWKDSVRDLESNLLVAF